MTTPLSEIIAVSDIAWQTRQPGVRGKDLWAHPATNRRAVLTWITPARSSRSTATPATS